MMASGIGNVGVSQFRATLVAYPGPTAIHGWDRAPEPSRPWRTRDQWPRPTSGLDGDRLLGRPLSNKGVR
jgi:hypothetical protein